MNSITFLDDKTRPKASPIQGVTDTHRSAGQKLQLIHQMHISALDETKAMMERVERGQAEADRLATNIENLDLIANYRRFGNLCGRECQFLDFHHTSEDTEIFPLLRAKGDDALRKVIDRLAEEHLIVHQLLETLLSNVYAIRTKPDAETFAQARATFSQLYKVIRSHFGYEETELQEALGFYGAPL